MCNLDFRRASCGAENGYSCVIGLIPSHLAFITETDIDEDFASKNDFRECQDSIQNKDVFESG